MILISLVMLDWDPVVNPKMHEVSDNFHHKHVHILCKMPKTLHLLLPRPVFPVGPYMFLSKPVHGDQTPLGILDPVVNPKMHEVSDNFHHKHVHILCKMPKTLHLLLPRPVFPVGPYMFLSKPVHGDQTPLGILEVT